MGIAERKLEEKQEMRKRILDAARKIFLEKGYEKASIRNIANEISYSPGMIYFHFKDKSEVFYELHKEGFRLLMTRLKVLDSVADPFERLKAVGRVFIQFAQDNKDYYNLMFIEEPASKTGEAGGFQIAKEAISHLIELIGECQRQGRFQHADIEDFSFMFLSSVHGICALFCKDRTTNFQNKTNEELMEHGYACFVSLLEKG
ncbi:TetR/AcrR family transcriptional regulator [Pararcticibacter amylolyticus]|uniref:TetR family transcriptional regulator n=1 Tax=Pararcticibacter amylolyticus TaxID=2173175 RepID=A0A2U2PJ28_9SPHI|nr:TetR/AcrR family transcriptional regulator [Pararcticibacter amylolyticus]PWG81407.1 TetR family transcriptional regulator [Pararcticibacter amylolyticus]